MRVRKAEVAIIGGGLAGLTAAIHLASAGIRIILFEKNPYPHHKVCGEYLSIEILPYLQSLGINLKNLKPVSIHKLIYSTHSGKLLKASLPLGGIGVSRYALDNFLYAVAKEKGVSVIQDNVTDISFEDDTHRISTAEKNSMSAEIVLGAYGKRSGLDKKLEREFVEKKNGWLAVKAHYQADDYPDDVVSLHNFPGGYCGLSRIETGAVNVCYLATYKSFKEHKDPKIFKEKVLCRNKNLESFFANAHPLFEKDLSIAQISFDKKSLIKDHILMLGDAAALIHPLCGNGMAMAIHSAKLASETIIEHLRNDKIERSKLETAYANKWKSNFSTRLKTGSILQRVLLNSTLAEISQSTINIFPGVLREIIRRTHGTSII